MSKIFKEEYKENERYAIFKQVADGKISPQKADDLIIELYNNKCRVFILSCVDSSMWYKDKIKEKMVLIKKDDKKNNYIVEDNKTIKQWDAVIIPK